MKVNMNQAPEKKPASAKLKPGKKSFVQAPAADNSGNVYKDAIKGYTDKWKAGLQSGEIFRQNKFWIIVAVVLFIVFLTVNSNINNTKTRFMVQLKRAATETESLNSAISEVRAELEEQARINSAKLTEEEEELARNNAEAQGKHVAYLQNQYRDISIDDPAFRDKMDKNKNELDVCFNEEGKRNGKGIWYPYYDSGIPGKWEFASNASFKGNTAKVLWLCYADDPDNPQDHTLLAYCTAKYNADTKLFTNIDIKITRYALANTRSDDEMTTNIEQIMSVEDVLKELAGEDEILDTELSEKTINIDNEVSNINDFYKESVADNKAGNEEHANVSQLTERGQN